MKGRPPKPIEQHRRAGNPSKKKLPSRARQTRVAGSGTDVDWSPPEALRSSGRAHWEEIVAPLRASRMLDRADRPILELMCVQWELIVGARLVVVRSGLMTAGSKGQRVVSPAVSILHNASVLYLRYAEQFGMTASARARLDIARAGVGDPTGELEQLIGRSPLLKVIPGGKKSKSA